MMPMKARMRPLSEYTVGTSSACHAHWKSCWLTSGEHCRRKQRDERTEPCWHPKPPTTRNVMMRLEFRPNAAGCEKDCGIRDTADMEYSLEQMARSLVESGDYRVTSRLDPQAEYHAPDSRPKLVAAVVDVETTGTNPDRDKIIELGICLFEYDRQTGQIYKVLGSWEWFEDPGISIPPEVTNITGITDEMLAVAASMITPSTIC
jgi:hypothetical protein